MAFKMRTTKPEAGNKYYITKANGGYSNAIKGKPTDPNCDVLSNCFDGATKFITSEGIKTLLECENKEIKVLSEDGLFRDATVKNFGKQELYKITFNNGSSYLVTANHRWVVDKLSRWKDKKYYKRIIKTTLDLNSCDHIPYELAEHTNDIDSDGIRHGFIYGDGAYYNGYRQSLANLCGFKKEYMLEWFEDAKHITYCSNGTISAYPYPKEYKELPQLSESQSYLRGFIAGYLASDGCIGKDGSVRLDSAKYSSLEYIKNICSIIGIRTTPITTALRTGYGEEPTELHHIYFYRDSVDSALLLNPEHKRRFLEMELKEVKYTRVKSIEPTGIITDVYCVQEPETHTMVLEDNILTGQCVGYAYGRFNEIGGYGYCKYLSPVNAENFMQYKGSLKTGQTPKVGACMVWKKGATLSNSDGAGHVAIVEKVISPTQVMTSESAYGGAAFYTQNRSKGSGNWGMGNAYTFLGFIYNPAVSGSTTTTAATNTTSVSTVLRFGSTGNAVKELQNNLIKLGYSCGSYGADGDFGAATESAVRRFQTANKLVVDGIAGANTLSAIDKAIKSKATKIKITASVLNVRAGAGMNYRVLTTVKKNSTHELLEEKNGWGRISKGWISSTYYKKI